MIPSLPQNDPHPERRAAALAESRATYQFDFGYYDLGFAREVPKADGYSLEYEARKNQVLARIAANQAAYWMAERTAENELGVRSLLRKATRDMRERGLHRLWSAATDAKVLDFHERDPVPIASYERMFQLIEKPELADDWDEDLVFAWQRVSGCNPYVLRRVAVRAEAGRDLLLLADLERRMGLTDDDFQLREPGDSLRAAAESHRLYVADYAILHGIEAGVVDQWRHYLRSPLALFVVPNNEDDRHLHPVAISLDGRAGSPTFLRPLPAASGAERKQWSMAKQVVQVADANHQGVVMHLGECHMVAEALILSTRRALAPTHPLRLLLEPHFQFTLPTNVSTKGLIEPGGITQTVQSVSRLGAIRLLKLTLDAFRWDERSPPRDFERRGVDDAAARPEYPARDDGNDVFAAIHTFAREYVRLYYGLDADVVKDPEVQAWFAELSSPSAGRIQGINGDRPWATTADLARFVAEVVYRLTGLHATINYPSFSFMGYAPLMPAGGYHPGPDVPQHDGDGSPISPWDPRWMMPPRDVALKTLAMVTVLRDMKVNRLGRYPGKAFTDPRVPPLVIELQAALKQVEGEIERRNQGRLVPYRFLLPSEIPASIHV